MNKKVLSTTQEHLDIADIKEDIVILKTGGAVCVIETNAINFDLLSIQEQDAAIIAYSSLLNSLAFPIQVVIRSKKTDISEYLEKVKEAEDKQTSSKIKTQIRAYRSFIQDELVKKQGVLEKNFYVVVPYKMGTFFSANPLGFLDDLFGFKTKGQSRINVDKILQEAKADLEPKKNFIIKEFARIGIKAASMKTAELTSLYYEIYNSETAQAQKIRGNIEDYTTALVEPKIK